MVLCTSVKIIAIVSRCTAWKDSSWVRLGCTYGEDPGEFDNPRGLAVDSAGVLYVCDTNNNRIQVF